MSENEFIYGGEYEGPQYVMSQSVKNMRSLPRFGYTSDFTVIFSSRPDQQADYAAGLVFLFVFLLIFFIFWTVLIFVFKCMGPGNAGFLSGHHFVIPDPAEDDKHVYKRPFRVRLVFLIASALLMLYAVLFVTMGLTNVDNTFTTMAKSLKLTGDLVKNAELIARELEEVGTSSIEIRDAAVAELDDFCPANPNIDELAGVDVMGIAEAAKDDLTMLANFIKDGLSALNSALSTINTFTSEANKGLEQYEFWGWQMKLLSAGLFILPSFFVVGVGLVMLDLDVKPYQHALTYFCMPLFLLVTVVTYIVCCALLPIAATNADVCTGGGVVHAGPDDTVLTIYRNLRGDDTSIIFMFIAYYTQRCNPRYYPFGFLSSYLNDLDDAIKSTDNVVDVVNTNIDMLEAQCGRSFDNVPGIVQNMNNNLRTLREQADLSLDLIRCENINSLYVNTIHEATCTYSVEAMAWIFASSLVIAICGLIMIMLRSSYYPAQYLELSEEWIKTPPSNESRENHVSRGKASPTNSVASTDLNSPSKTPKKEAAQDEGEVVAV